MAGRQQGRAGLVQSGHSLSLSLSTNKKVALFESEFHNVTVKHKVLPDQAVFS